MNESSYLNPESIRAQCDAAIKNLEEDNRANGLIMQKIMEFIAEPTLVGKSFEALRQQMLDYLTVLQTMKLANEADIRDFRFLKLVVVGQELNGSDILEQQEAALSSKQSAEENIEKYKKKLRKEKSITLQTQYDIKIAHYTTMAELSQKLYNEWKKKEETYDGIERMTSGLFEEGEAIRATVESALDNMQGAFQDGKYVSNMQAAWRGEIAALFNKDSKELKDENKVKDWKNNISREIQTQLLKMGYTQREIDLLCIREIHLTSNDINNLKKTIGTKKIYRTEDAKALIYNGKVYYIYVPSNGPAYESNNWIIDWKKELTKMDFDLVAGTLGISLEDIPKEDVFDEGNMLKLQDSKISYKDKNATTASILHLLVGMEQFMTSALKHKEISLFFQSMGDDRKVEITVGDSQTRLMFQQIDYNMPINTYQNANDWMGEKYASDYAQGIYQAVTGERVPDEEGAYTITGTLDEGHRECNISGYLSYSEEGNLLYTPLVFPGDTAYVSQCMPYTGYFPKEILEFTDLLSNPVIADEEVRNIFEQALEGR